jgi:hypothetical protein
MDLVGELLDALRELLRDLGEPGVLLQKPEHLGRLLGGELLSLEARLRQCLAMLRIRIGMRLVAIGLPSLGEQDEWRGVRRLQAEREG